MMAFDIYWRVIWMGGVKGFGSKSGSVFWGKHVDAWSLDGSTQAEYCRRHDLILTAFGYWKRKLLPIDRPKSQEPAVPPQFVEVRLKEVASPIKQSGANIKLLIGDEFTIEVPDRFCPDSLRSLVIVLRDLS